MDKNTLTQMTRRGFMRLTGAAAGVAAWGALSDKVDPTQRINAAPLNQKRLVVINLSGGNDSLNMVIPRTVAEYQSRRTGLAIPAGQELALSGNTSYGLHPKLVNIQSLYNAGDVAIVNKVGFPTPNLSHQVAQDIYSYGVRGSFIPLSIPISGWLARYADAYAVGNPMGVASIGFGKPLDFSGGVQTNFLVDSLSRFQFFSDPYFTNNHTYRINIIKSILAANTSTGLVGNARAALDASHTLSVQVQAAVADYVANFQVAYRWPGYPGTTATPPGKAATSISNRLRDISILINGGFNTQVFYTGFGGFDTHAAQGQGTGAHATLMEQLDDAIGAFAADMQAMGQWNNVALVVITEFGRRNYVNGSAGTDHGHATAVMVIGGAINGGVYGPDITSTDLQAEYLSMGVDFRYIYSQLVANHMGRATAPVFPESFSAPGTPFTVI